ncbi:sulfatase-like hydrolase/transferase [Planococcus sp. ISL-110]|uniref:LTA synthase family protein n=1 Tax=Planococcus sp. ISL-110 TaxID=2819167 RepID=UPI0033396A0D
MVIEKDFYQNIGFKHFFSQTDFPATQEIGMALNDEDFLTISIELAEQLKEPYFAFMVALSSHTPYEIPAELEQLDLAGYEDSLLKGYYETVHYVVGAVGEMIEELKQKDLWDGFLIVFYGDGDRDRGLTQPDSEMAQELVDETKVELFEVDHQVPLFIKEPDMETGSTVDSIGGQIDIAPAILYAWANLDR